MESVLYSINSEMAERARRIIQHYEGKIRRVVRRVPVQLLSAGSQGS